MFKRFKPKKIVSGKIGEIKTIKKTENVIYVSTIQSLYDYIFILLMISHFKLPFPRFFVNKSAVKIKNTEVFYKTYRWIYCRSGKAIEYYLQGSLK